MQLEDQILRKELLRPPDNPTNTDVGETKFVAGRVDGNYAGDFEIPFKFRSSEGSDEPSGGTVDVNWDRVAGTSLKFVEQFGHLLHRFVVARVCA